MPRVGVFVRRAGAFLDGVAAVAGAAAPARGSGLCVRTDVRQNRLSFALPPAPPPRYGERFLEGLYAEVSLHRRSRTLISIKIEAFEAQDRDGRITNTDLTSIKEVISKTSSHSCRPKSCLPITRGRSMWRSNLLGRASSGR